MNRRRLFVAAGVLLPAVAVLALLAYGFTREPRYIESPMLGRPAPALALTLFAAGSVRLENLRGKVVFLSFWASWCPPCRAEAPMLETMWRQLKDQDVVFLGVNTQDEELRAQAFLDEFGITYRAGRITFKHIGTVGRTLLAAKINEARRGVVSASQGRGEYQSTR